MPLDDQSDNDDGKMSQEEFLNYIQQIESSGGKNLNHPVVQSGVNAGDHAVGRYGLMPNTIRDTVKRGVASGTLPPEMNNIDPSQLRPSAEDQIAKALASRVLNKYHDPAMAAYSWNQGTSLSPDQIKQRDFMNSDYVQKFNKLRQMMGNK